MIEPLKIDYIGQNCAMPSADDVPYNISIYLNRELDRYEQELVQEHLVSVESEEGVPAGTLRAGVRIILVIDASRNDFKSRYRSLVIKALDRVNDAAPTEGV